MSSTEPQFATIAALFGDPARANILRALMDGRARTAKELALAAGVTPQTTSGHLAKLVDAQLLDVASQGRHRYYRLSNGLVACAIESMMALAGERVMAPHRHSPRLTAELREARTCYDHLAGRLGVRLFDRLLQRDCLIAPAGPAEDFQVTRAGRQLFAEMGIDVDSVARQRRGFARPCLDWSERVPHLAGSLGAAIASRCFELGWLIRRPDSRAVTLTRRGREELDRLFGLGSLVPGEAPQAIQSARKPSGSWARATEIMKP
ncbi:MAG TPA: winged helix-turn-helix domain-containing protein [Ferrovibrio sp.]|jgi:DNA-binding transcriptional ArsR family regulator|uniref:ArsR/SmtB family transcription factor n=1 Tax=Ferrovibrio sp. TaxID=1917215 RepID=UPI002B4B54A0|nr:winged helix-turn-helix domain-containing protein [Ferrovibrio sp.]HLT77071.1 winged helix-turn-helix domain-containing protein [Ferrovibrio sp.]